MFEDYVLGTAAATIVGAAVVLGVFLSRYRKMVDEANQSARLAKDVWDSVNSRLSVMDTRIIDLMAKTEMLVSRVGTSQVSRDLPVTPRLERTNPFEKREATELSKISVERGTAVAGEGTETEKSVLRLLAEGARDSAEIREQIGKSREHTARLMKSLFDRGLVVRNDKNKPYVYQITENGRSYLTS